METLNAWLTKWKIDFSYKSKPIEQTDIDCTDASETEIAERKAKIIELGLKPTLMLSATII